MQQMSPAARKQAIASVFDWTADTYDSVIGYFSHFGREAVDAAEIRPGERVLDVCCGLGAALLPAAGATGPKGQAVGVDLAPGMVEGLRRLIAEQELTRAEARIMDAENLEFEAATFDVVICAFGIMFLPHLAEALRGFHRVLRPGGRAVVAVWSKSTPEFGFVGDRAKEFGGFDFKGDGAPPPWAGEGLTTLLASAGFRSVRIVETEARFEFADADTWWRWGRSHGSRALMESVPEANAAAFREAVMRDYASVSGGQGRCTLTQSARIAVAGR